MFEDFRRFGGELELFVNQDILKILKIKIRVEVKLKLVGIVISQCMDDKFIFMLLVKGEGHVEFLVLGVANDTGGHG